MVDVTGSIPVSSTGYAHQKTSRMAGFLDFGDLGWSLGQWFIGVNSACRGLYDSRYEQHSGSYTKRNSSRQGHVLSQSAFSEP